MIYRLFFQNSSYRQWKFIDINNVYLRYWLFWAFTHHWMVIPYRRFGKTYLQFSMCQYLYEILDKVVFQFHWIIFRNSCTKSINYLNTKRRLLYLNSQSVPRSKHFRLGYISLWCDTSRWLFSNKYKTHKYSLGRAYNCWMLNWWCITWPVGFKSLINLELCNTWIHSKLFTVSTIKLANLWTLNKTKCYMLMYEFCVRKG
jgi:hypothetical protein